MASATRNSERIMVPAMEQRSQTQPVILPTDTVFAACECCGLMEECTPKYVQNIRQRFLGRMICGLCSEAVLYERNRDSSLEQALANHFSVCRKFQNSPPPLPDPMVLVSALVGVLRRRNVGVNSAPATPTTEADRVPTFGRSESCAPGLRGV